MTTADATLPDSLDGWIESWDRQQEMYVPEREQRLQIVIDAVLGLAEPIGSTLRVLDLGCGPAALGARILARVPTATYVGVETDPVMLHLAEAAGARYGDRFSLRDANLTSTAWSDGLAPESFDAIVSSTALHWLGAPDLARVLHTGRALLHDGGVFVNADGLRFRPGSERLQTLADLASIEHQQRAEAAGAPTWAAWWEQARADAELGPLCLERDRIFPPDPASTVDGDEDDGSETRPPVDLYIGLLHDAGFGVVDTVWQRFDDRVLVALPDPAIRRD